MRAKFIFLCLVFYLFIPVSGESAETGNRIVALVQDDVITLYELNNKVEEVTGKKCEEIKAQGEEYYIETGDKVLDMLIDERIANEKIQELDLKITDDEIDNYIEGLKNDNQWTHEEFLAKLEEQGLTYAKLREKLKEDMERRRLIESEVQSKIVISDEEVEKYYNERSEEYWKPGGVEIAGIFLISQDPADLSEKERLIEKGNNILKRLKNGESFGDLAREFSQGPGADEGGNLGTIKVSQINADLLNVVDNLAEGEVSGLIKRDNSVQIIKLLRREGAGLIPLEEVKDKIYETLYTEEINKRYNAWFNELRSSCYIKKLF
jgi:peptidyl-prolyl cis-trans isomerase SurA